MNTHVGRDLELLQIKGFREFVCDVADHRAGEKNGFELFKKFFWNNLSSYPKEIYNGKAIPGPVPLDPSLNLMVPVVLRGEEIPNLPIYDLVINLDLKILLGEDVPHMGLK